MFIISLYNNSSEKNKVGKNLTLIKAYNGVLREETDIVNPSFLIETDNMDNEIFKANYAEVPMFGRKYFVTKITIVRNNLVRVDMHCDVLDSFQMAIKSNTAILERSENFYNLYLPDNRLDVQQDMFSTFVRIGNKQMSPCGIASFINADYS